MANDLLIGVVLMVISFFVLLTIRAQIYEWAQLDRLVARYGYERKKKNEESKNATNSKDISV